MNSWYSQSLFCPFSHIIIPISNNDIVTSWTTIVSDRMIDYSYEIVMGTNSKQWAAVRRNLGWIRVAPQWWIRPNRRRIAAVHGNDPTDASIELSIQVFELILTSNPPTTLANLCFFGSRGWNETERIPQVESEGEVLLTGREERINRLMAMNTIQSALEIGLICTWNHSGYSTLIDSITINETTNWTMRSRRWKKNWWRTKENEERNRERRGRNTPSP